MKIAELCLKVFLPRIHELFFRRCVEISNSIELYLKVFRHEFTNFILKIIREFVAEKIFLTLKCFFNRKFHKFSQISI